MIFNAISAASGGGGAKIATGSYVGTGTYGSSNPCSLTFDFEPKILVISEVSRANEAIMQYGCGLSLYKFTSGYGYSITLSWTGMTVSWYQKDAAYAQLNTSRSTYRWTAIG